MPDLLPNLLGMGKSPLILAALATDAVSGLNVRNAVTITGESGGHFDSALLTDINGEHYVVRIPTTPAAGTELELELQVLKNLSSFRSRLGFDLPQAVGETREIGTGARVLVFKYVEGDKIDTRRLSPASALAQSIARSIAAIHALPIELIQNNGLTEFSPAENIRLRVAELDRAMQSGQVPTILLQRWEDALSDVSLFKYQPVVVHGSLGHDTILEAGGEVSGVLDWKKVHLGDPAVDFAWLADEHNELVDSILLNYQLQRNGADSNISRRATLYSELEWVRWLLHGYSLKDPSIVEEAISGLNELAEAAAEGNLFPLSEIVAAPPVIVDSISFIEQNESDADYGYSTDVTVEEIEIVEVVTVESQQNTGEDPDDKTKPLTIVRDEGLF
ncbi:MAG: hypothetical protein RL149_966 [Actinomycetota bacterium]|jgi:aminoglycoside phosphotransferase (APT) family kinase protein